MSRTVKPFRPTCICCIVAAEETLTPEKAVTILMRILERGERTVGGVLHGMCRLHRQRVGPERVTLEVV